MATSFDRWEKDPFFSAAEEVQESADRMESTYRTWIHAKKDASNILDAKELRRDLHTALGTTKWQLEEFAKAVQSSYKNGLADDARDRHREFISAIEDQISKIENSLEESARSEGKVLLPWVRLDEGECSELALFLSGPSVPNDKTIAKVDEGDCSELALFLSGPSAPNAKTIAKVNGNDNEVLQAVAEDSAPNHLKNSIQSVGCSSDAREEKLHGHRRTASASAGIGAWQIAINDDSYLQNSSNGQLPIPPRKIPSVSGFLNSMESAAKLNWSKNGNRKWKAADRFQEADTALLRSSQLTRGINACYEKSKSCLDSCDDYYDKQLYGWYGAIQRQLQRSQYQMQYSRPVQVTFWIVVLLCLIALITLYAI